MNLKVISLYEVHQTYESTFLVQTYVDTLAVASLKVNTLVDHLYLRLFAMDLTR